MRYPRRDTLPLLVPIRTEHYETASNELAALTAELKQVGEALDAAKKRKKAIEDRAKEINKMQARKEWREPVPCEWRKVGQMIQVVRLDTNDMIETFPDESNDRPQRPLFEN